MITVRQLLEKMNSIDERVLDYHIHDVNGNAADLIITVQNPITTAHYTGANRIGQSVYFDLTQ